MRKTTLCGLLQKDLGFGYVSLANVLEPQAATEDPMAFFKWGIKSFDSLKGTRYRFGKNAVVCTTHAIYPIGEDAYALPVTAI